MVSRPDEDALLRLAREGGGAYRRITADNDDLVELLKRGRRARAGVTQAGVHTERWRDEGPLLLLLLAPLAALGFRRGWVLVLLAAPLGAIAADGWFATADQRARRAFEEGDYRRAASLFEDLSWQATALYRQDRFLEAARVLEGSGAPSDRYNRATAMARGGEIETAIRLYEDLLLDYPDHADAAPSEQSNLDESLLPEHTQRWLLQVPDDPGGLLRRKFQQQYKAGGLDQDGNSLWPGSEADPW